MNVPVDPRIAARRRAVVEAGARRRLRGMVGYAVLLALVGLAVWATQSTLLDVDRVRINGMERSDAAARLQASSIEEGVPIVAAIWRISRAEKAVESDPWVRDASVSVIVPDAVHLEVLEHRPAAWVADGSGWLLVSTGGHVLERSAQPDEPHPRVTVPGVRAAPGDELADAQLLGAIQFVAALDDRLGADTTVATRGDGLWAQVAGRQVKLGRPVDMTAKAAALQAVLAEVPEGWAINVVAPSRPASWDPDPAGPGLAEPGTEAESLIGG